MTNNKILEKFIFSLFFRIATDIVEERLQKAKQMGADVLVNGKMENLKDIGLWVLFSPKYSAKGEGRV